LGVAGSVEQLHPSGIRQRNRVEDNKTIFFNGTQKEIAELFPPAGVMAFVGLGNNFASADARVYLQVVLPTSIPQILARYSWADRSWES